MDYMTLTNANSQNIQLRFRAFEAKDADAVVNIIRDEYGDNYHKRSLYDTEYLVRLNESGELRFYVAELISGEMIGCLSLKREGTACSIATGIILKQYRRYGIFFPFVKYIAAQIRKFDNISAIYCRMILYHDITQKLMARLGLKVCAFVPSLILAENFRHSYTKDDNLKLTLGIMIRRGSKHDAGTIYLPVEHTKFAQNMYRSLRVGCAIRHEQNIPKGGSLLTIANDAIQQSCSIEVNAIGADLIYKIREVQAEFSGEYQTFNVFLNVSDEAAVTAYRELVRLGYFFAGFKPICGANEVMILHNPRNVSINFDTLKLTREFETLREYVKRAYESRCPLEN